MRLAPGVLAVIALGCRATPKVRPPEVATGNTIPAGTSFRVVDISPSDAYVASKDAIIGLTCTVADQLHETSPGWYGGSADCSDGTNYYFYAASITDIGTATVTAPEPPVPEPTPEPTPTPDPTPTPSYTLYTWGTLNSGATFSVIDLRADDRYYFNISAVVGLTCTVDADLEDGGTGWYAGAAVCSDGYRYYFLAAAIQNVTMRPDTTAVPNSYGELPSGTTFVVTGFSPSDGYHGSLETFYNHVCTASGSLTESSPGWYAGSATCDDGNSYYFAAAGVSNVNKPAAIDTDGDGILDTSDSCPGDAEDADGFQDWDGCPDYDNDGDGVADSSDYCPSDAEDADGFQDWDGCPDLDNDGDRIPDSRDYCPDQPENYNMKKDSDGCPD